ncbi:MAG: hypothetical protein PHW77_06350, partial [Eubacteriales bacterium]|nr:hypothetical protein [Eubacteriales bacterium]
MENSKNVKLMVSMIYDLIICISIAIIMTVLLILLLVASDPPNIYIKIIGVMISGIGIVIGLMGAIGNYQTAILDESGITFNLAMKKNVKINWEDIVKADIQNLDTLYSNIKVYQIKWIILYTAFDQVAKNGGGNSTKPPYQ